VKLSARNQLRGTVTEIVEGPASTNVVIEVSGERIVSSITTEAARELGLREGSDVVAVIKASDVIVAVA
jgi:molybdopterin-binding protein